MKTFIMRLVLCLAVMGMSQTVSAQGFLGKLKKSAEKLTATTGTESETAATADTAAVADKIKESEIPLYSAKKFYETDEQGVRLKNEDGTDKVHVFLVDREGNKVSAESVAAQSKQINDAILKIAAKVAAGAGIGALTGKGKGALIGLAAGIGLSVNDILLVVKLKKNAMKQKKVIEAYQKNYDAEGNPVAAQVDPKDLKTLDLVEENSVNETTAKIKEDLQNMGEVGSNESIDALLAAATKV